jgi:hypothetical protein
VAAGQSATFAAVASGSTPLSYQWRKGGATIDGATASSYTIAATTSADNGSTYAVVVSNSAGSATSNGAVLTVSAVPALQITTSSLPGGAVQGLYSATLHASFPVSADNVVRELVIDGKSWKEYADDLPSVGYTGGDSGNYAVRHDPLAYLTDVQNDATQRQNLVPFTQFAADLAAGELPNYAFVTPNLCNDAHDCGLDVADSWLATQIAPLLSDAAFRSDGLLIIVFDESGADNTHGGGRVAAALVSPAFSKPGYKSTTLYQHESTLRLMLEGLGVKTLPGAAAAAPAMWEFFTFPPPP